MNSLFVYKFKYIIAIALILGFHVTCNIFVLAKSSINRDSDEACILRNGLEFYKTVFSNDSSKITGKIDGILTIKPGTFHPPLYEIVQGAAWKMMDIFSIKDENLMVVLANSAFLLLLISSVYGIGCILCNRDLGLLSAFLLSFFPVIFGHSRVIMADLPLTAMVSLTFFLLFKTDEFRSCSYSILLGVTAGLAQLTKEGFILIVLIPFIYYLWHSCRIRRTGKSLINAGIFLAVYISIVVIFFWKASNLHVFKIYFFRSVFEQTAIHFLYYIERFWVYQGPLLLILYIPLFTSAFLNFKNREKVLFLWFLAPLIIFSFSPNKTIRFLLPIAPAISLLTARELFLNDFFAKFKKKYVAALFIFALLQYFLFNLGIIGKFYGSNFNAAGLCSVKKDRYIKINESIMNFLIQEKIPEGKKNILFLFYVGKINWPIMNKCMERGISVRVKWPTSKWNIVSDPSKEISGALYVIEKEGCDELYGESRDQSKLRTAFNESKAGFKKFYEINAEGTNIVIYKNTSAVFGDDVNE